MDRCPYIDGKVYLLCGLQSPSLFRQISMGLDEFEQHITDCGNSASN